MQTMIVDEDDFQARVMKDHIYPHHKSAHSQIRSYAKLTHIKGRRTVSEIDLVVVEGRERAFAYEFKVLRGKARVRSRNYKRIYQGLGQALLYFWYGFDQSTLCIGISEDLDTFTRKKIEAKIIQAGPVIDEIRKTMPYFGCKAFFEEKDKLKRVRVFSSPKASFPVKTRPMQEDREAILAGNVRTRGESFLRKHGLVLSKL
jgi:hypothetical protein